MYVCPTGAVQSQTKALAIDTLSSTCSTQEVPKQLKSRAFALAALTALERSILYILPYTPDDVAMALLTAHAKVRNMWDFPPPRNMMMDLRDLWPEDKAAGDALHEFLKRLDTLEDGD